MNARTAECEYNEMGLWVVHPDHQAEIGLEGPELLRLVFLRPGAAVTCTGGALWLTQPGDAQDHIIRAGETFPLYRPGVILVQGLPRGRAVILET